MQQKTWAWSLTIVLFLAILFPACKETGNGNGMNGSDSTGTHVSMDTNSATTTDTIPPIETKPEILLTFTSGNVAPGSAFHVFGARDVIVEEGDLTLADLHYEHFELTVLYEDTAFARIIHDRPDRSRQRARFVKGEENVPRRKMVISGFVDEHMTTWLLKEVENYMPESEAEPR